jgi:hypothetical protein
MASRRTLAWLLGAAVVIRATAALAEPSPQQKELARDLMQKGRDARAVHDLKLALESFKGADDIMHVPTTGFEVARAQVDLGLLVEAHETLLAVQRIPEGQAEPQAFRDARGYARVLDAEVAQRIPQLRIALSGTPPGAHGERAIVMAVDGVALPEGALLVPYKVDPGHHVITVKSEGVQGGAETDVAEGQSRDVVVTLTPAVAAVAPEGGSPRPTTEQSAPERARVDDALGHESAGGSGGGPGALGWTGFAVAAAGVATGTVTGIITLSDKSSIASRCNGTRCPPSTYDDLTNANTFATISTVAFAVGGVGAAVGVVSWLLRPSTPDSPAVAPVAVRVHPAVGLGTVGFAGTF